MYDDSITFPVIVDPSNLVEIDTYLPATIKFSITLTLPKSASSVIQIFEQKVINICSLETMAAVKTEFLLVAQKNKANVL